MRPAIVFAFFGLFHWVASAQTYSISTFAGGGLPVNIPATSASLSLPEGVAVDKAGNVFFADAWESIVLRLDATTHVLTLVAGNGTTGYSGDNGAATNAQLNFPYGVAVDSAGNVYIADELNNAIRKVSDGVITTIAGNGTKGYTGDNGPAATAQLNQPYGVAVDSAGVIFVADTGNEVVRRISGGTITTVAGNGTLGYSGDNGPATSAELGFPWAIAVDAADSLYIVDNFRSNVREVSNGTITTIAGSTPGELIDTRSVAVDSAGNVYIGDQNIYEISNGVMTPFMKGVVAEGLAVDSNGDLFIADPSGSVISEVANGVMTTLAGNGTERWGNGPAAGSQLFLASSGPAVGVIGGVAVDAADNLYFAENSRVIRRISNGVITTVAGNGTASSLKSSNGDGGPATSAQLSPSCVAVDSAGDLFIADIIAQSVREVSNGAITTVAGINEAGFYGDNGPATSAMLNGPAGLAVDSSGNLYIADSGNNRIRKVSNGVITTVAGNGTAGYGGDNGPAASAMLNYPVGVAVDAAGSLYIADAGNDVIRKVSNGTITTLAGNQGFPTSVAVDADDNLYVAESSYLGASSVYSYYSVNSIQKVSGGVFTTLAGTGVAGFSGDNGPAASAELNNPTGVAVDSAGNVYVNDSQNNRIRLLTPGAKPVITPGGIVPVYSSVSTVQPGSWVSIYGSNLASGTVLWNNDFPQSLGGTSVTIDNRLAYLWFVSPTQINLQVPDDTATGLVSVVVNTPSGTTTSTVALSPFAPSFSLLGDGRHVAGEILTSNGYDLVGPSDTFSFATRPVNPGETLVLYGVGFGPTNPFVPAGQAFSASAPTANKVAITIGGVAANVSYSGITEEGLYQFNVTVPNAPSGDQALQATVDGVQTPLGPVVTIQ